MLKNDTRIGNLQLHGKVHLRGVRSDGSSRLVIPACQVDADQGWWSLGYEGNAKTADPVTCKACLKALRSKRLSTAELDRIFDQEFARTHKARR